MKRYSSNKRRSASTAKFFAAAFCLVLGWGAASLFPSGSTLGETWRFRLESFGLFSSNAQNLDDERPRSFLDASGRRVVCDGVSAPRLETAPTFVAESAELLANDALPLETESLGATFDEAESESEPASFANADAETPALNVENASWVFVDENAQERERWSRELRLGTFSEPTFAECSAPTWRDAVAVESATRDELNALAFEPGASSSSPVSPSLRRRSAKAPLVSGDYSFAETSNATDAGAPAPSSVEPSTPTPEVAPTRVGAFTACGAFDAYGAAKVRVK